MNIPPERTGRMNASEAAVKAEVGAALNATFGVAVASATPSEGGSPCALGVATLELHRGSAFDYVLSAEDLARGARVANYSVEYQPWGSDEWHLLVPPVPRGNASLGDRRGDAPLGDRPDGHDPRDSHIGRKRIDLPVVAALDVARVRLNCLEAWEEPVFIRSFSLHKRAVPWEEPQQDTAAEVEERLLE